MPNRQAVCTLNMCSFQSVGVGLDEAKGILKEEVHKCQQNSVTTSKTKRTKCPTKEQAEKASMLLSIPSSMIDLKDEEKIELENVEFQYALGLVGL